MLWTADTAKIHLSGCSNHSMCEKWATRANELAKEGKSEAECCAGADASVKESTVESFSEAFTCEGQSLTIDKAAGKIHNVKVLGLVSLNGRRYSPQAVASAVKLYEGKRVNVDHSIGSRSYRDRIGYLSNITLKNKELYGTLNVNPRHAIAEQLFWDAENAPGNVGLSHDCKGTVEAVAGEQTVTEIKSVRSVDLVGDPATTKGLFEGDGEIDDPVLRDLAEQAFSATSDIRTILLKDGVNIEHKRTQLRERLASLQGFVAASSTPVKETQDVGIEIKDLTEAMLKEQRPDLFAKITGTDEVSKLAGELKSIKEGLAAKDKAHADLKAENDTLKADAAKAALSEAISGELKAAKIDVSNKTICPDAMIAQLRECATPDARKPIIEYMAMAQKTFGSKGSGSMGVVPAPKELKEGADAPQAASSLAEFKSRL